MKYLTESDVTLLLDVVRDSIIRINKQWTYTMSDSVRMKKLRLVESKLIRKAA